MDGWEKRVAHESKSQKKTSPRTLLLYCTDSSRTVLANNSYWRRIQYHRERQMQLQRTVPALHCCSLLAVAARSSGISSKASGGEVRCGVKRWQAGKEAVKVDGYVENMVRKNVEARDFPAP